MICYFFALSLSIQKILSATWNEETQAFDFADTYDENATARALYSNDQISTGWYNLQVEGSRISDNTLESRAAGILEGRLTHALFKNHRKNVYAHLCSRYIECENGEIPDKILQFFTNNYKWVEKNLQTATSDEEFFFIAKMIFAQVNGIVEGYNMENPDDQITNYDMWMYMSSAMIYDLARTEGMSLAKSGAPTLTRRGTGIVGRTANLDDVYVGHTSWRHYGESIRIAKRYRIRYNSTYQVADRRTMSSYPFLLHSDDEFTISDQGIAIISSSIAMSDEAAKKVHYSVQGFPYWFRNIVATLSSHSNGEWFDNYKNLASTGTGIEYILVDMKKFQYKSRFQDEFVFAVDELPDQVAGRDLTEQFEQKRFIGTYDVPVIPEIYTAAGYETLAAEKPEWYSYTDSVRAKILQQKAQTITDDKKMKELIRLNNPKTVTQQNGSAVNAIAGRFELNTNSSLKQCFGAFDAKFTSVHRVLHSQWIGQVGVSTDYKDVPVLDLDNTPVCQDESREGVDPKLYNNWVNQYFDVELD